MPGTAPDYKSIIHAQPPPYETGGVFILTIYTKQIEVQKH
jgi:hypothetical protein